MKERLSIRKITTISVLLALAIGLSIVENYIPFGIPGAKLGLANLITILTLYFFGFWTGLGVSLLRVIAASLITGSFLGMGFMMSFAGALLSFLLMAFAKRFLSCFTVVGVSILGAFSHSLAQIFVAMAYYVSTSIMYYFPPMALISLITGTCIGFICDYALKNKYLQRIVEEKTTRIDHNEEKKQ